VAAREGRLALGLTAAQSRRMNAQLGTTTGRLVVVVLLVVIGVGWLVSGVHLLRR
jgi:hypothetical protein